MPSERQTTESLSSADRDADSSPKTIKIVQRASARRTHRACDRCRVKKSKCNGQQPCSTCKSSERTCVFSALRRRDIRKWHCHMQDTVDEAIQRLYQACRQSASFPGILPDEVDGHATTASILQGMGFTNLDLGPRAGGIHPTAPLRILPVHNYTTNIAVDSPTSSIVTSPDHNYVTYTANNNGSPSMEMVASMVPYHIHSDLGRSPILNVSNQQQSLSNQFWDAMSGRLHQPYDPHWHPQHPCFDTRSQEYLRWPPSQEHRSYVQNAGLPYVTAAEVERPHLVPEHGQHSVSAATCDYQDRSSRDQRRIWDSRDVSMTVSQ